MPKYFVVNLITREIDSQCFKTEAEAEERLRAIKISNRLGLWVVCTFTLLCDYIVSQCSDRHFLKDVNAGDLPPWAWFNFSERGVAK